MKYRLSILFCLLFLGSCATLSPIPDSKPSPKSAGVYNLEIEACGQLSVETGACVFGAGEVPTGEIRVRVPRTNTTGAAAQVQFVSAECNINEAYTALPGQAVALKVDEVLSVGKSCSLQVVMVTTWDKQDSFTFPVTPFVGRVLLLSLAHVPTKVDDSSVLGFLHTSELAGAQSGPVISIDTQGSSFGRVLYSGCGVDTASVPYSAAGALLPLPKLAQSCILLGTVLRLDQPGHLSFAVARTLVPAGYENLAPPILTLRAGQTDPDVSAVDLGETVARGGRFQVPKALAPTEYNIRQMTTSGRFSITHVKNGVIEWSLP